MVCARQRSKLKDGGLFGCIALFFVAVCGLTSQGCSSDSEPSTQSAESDARGRPADQKATAVKIAKPKRRQTLVDTIVTKADARVDEWQTEVLSDATHPTLALIAKLIEQHDSNSQRALESSLAEGFESQRLLPRLRSHADLVIKKDPTSPV